MESKKKDYRKYMRRNHFLDNKEELIYIYKK